MSISGSSRDAAMEVAAAHQKVLEALTSKLGVKFR
jgi:hypothetical protein